MSYTTGVVFVDTNILVYARDSSERRKHEIASVYLSELWNDHRGRISSQVLSEYYSIVTQKLSRPLLPADAQRDIRLFFAWNPEPVAAEVLESAWICESRFGLSWWDALILAAAQRSGAAFLLSEDFQHQQDYSGVRVINPFLAPR